MAFANVAGRAGFVLELDKSQLDRGLPQAEQQFKRSFDNMERTAQRSGVSSARSFDDLLTSVRGMRGEADELDRRLDTVGTGLDETGAAAGRLAGRLGLVGAAAVAGYQATRALSDALKVSGEEAVTTEGRFRNLGSALLRGDLSSALEAVSKFPKTLEDAGISADEAFQHFEQFKELAGTDSPFAELAQQAVDLATQMKLAQTTADALNFSLRTTNTLASGAQITFSGTGPEEGVGSPGAVAAGRAANEATGGTGEQGAPAPVPIGPDAKIDAQIAMAQANGDLQGVLRLQILKRDRLRKAYQSSHGNVKQREALYGRLASAEAAVVQTQRAIDAQRQADAQADASARQSAADAAARQYRAGLATREQQLQNRYAEAQTTPGQADDRRAASALSAFLGGESRDEKLDAGERAGFRSRQIAFIGQRTADTKAVADAAMAATREDLRLQEQVLRNNVAAAELTEKNKQDDIRALRRLRDFYRREERDADLTRAERQDARGDRIATQKRINDLLGKTTDDSAFSIADLRRMQFEFLQSLQGITNQFGGNLTADGAQTASHTWRTSKLTEQVVAGIDRLARATAHPGAKYARNVMAEAYGSAGSV